MNAITINQQSELTQATTINPAMFNSFINYIDRPGSTERAYIINLRQFEAWRRYRGINNPDRDDIISYRDYLINEHEAIMLDNDDPKGWKYRTDHSGNIIKLQCKPGTAAQYLRTVKQFYSWAETIYPGMYNPTKGIHPPKVETGTHKKSALDLSDINPIKESIISAAADQTAKAAGKDAAGKAQRSDEQGKRLLAMYLLAVKAGLRTVELSRANIKDIVTINGQAYIYIWGKGHSEADQQQPITPETKAAIDDYLSCRTDRPTKSSPLFTSTGNRSKGQRIAPTTISKMLKKAMQAAGFDSERLTAHSLRHTAAKAALEATGNNIYQTQGYMRHKNPATTEIYLENDHLKSNASIAAKIDDLCNGNQQQSNDDLLDLLNGLNEDQLAQLTGIAKAIRENN